MGLFGSLKNSIFEFVSDFDIRISNLEKQFLQIIPHRVISKADPKGLDDLLVNLGLVLKSFN